MTYSEILQELKRNNMSTYSIERYEIEEIALNNYIAHIILNGQDKKAYITAEVKNFVQVHTRENCAAYGGINCQKLIELSGPIVKLGLNVDLDFYEDSPVSLYFVDKKREK